ncbi:hypothetical protein ACTXNJ_12985 [Pseudomonas helleri]|uniref:hypothetical protein n=1 Tax=Pseudomonas helleri TaxID=1608996 RepID=UPI003FCFA14B
MGHKIALPDTYFSDTTLPVLRDDPLLSSGSLVLIDLGHSKGRLASVPTSGSLVSNIAASIATGLVGSASVSPDIMTAYTIGHMAPELSSKGGLHVIKSKVNDLNNTRFTMRVPAAIKAYLLANPAHSYYFSVWQQITRKFDVGVPVMGLAGNAFTNDFWLNLDSTGLPAGIGTKSIGKATNLNPTLATGTAKHQHAVSGATGAIVSMPYTDLFIFGGCPSAGVMNSAVNKGGSQIMYRVYLEDLTVSERTYDQVKALDDELYAAAFAPGGKFYGDTHSDPVTTLA